MKRNNDFMLATLKRLCRTEKKTSPVVINAYNVVKRIDGMKVKKVREMIKSVLTYVKEKNCRTKGAMPCKNIMKDMVSPMVRPSKKA